MRHAKALALFGLLMMSTPEWDWVPYVNGLIIMRGHRIDNMCDFQNTNEGLEVLHRALKTPQVTAFVDAHCRVFLIELPPIAVQ